MEKEIGIYIHIPFCESKCYYCNFSSFCNMDGYIEKYIDAVCKEIISQAEILSEYKIKTVYFGGGTPSYIDSKYIQKILDTLKLFKKSDNEFVEITIEVNPNSATLEKILSYKNIGINRLSIGLQSTDNKVLKNIGRVHTYEDFFNVLNYAKEANITNLSTDLIYPLPGLNLKGLNDELNKIISLKDEFNIKHISIYNLEVHEDTKLEFLLSNGFLEIVDEDEEYEMKNIIHKKLTTNLFNQYEISNFAISGYESMHNTNYWNQGSYLGFGATASSFILGSRYKNVDDIKEYINGVNNFSNIISEKEDMDKLDLMKEYVILKLRLIDGIYKEAFKIKFSIDIFDIFNNEIKELEGKGLIINDEKNIYLSERGKEVANIVWEKFI